MKKLIVVVVVLLVLLLGLYEIVHWGFERVYVAEDEALMVADAGAAAEGEPHGEGGEGGAPAGAKDHVRSYSRF